ncbi:MAG: hypothetical protein MK073_02505 [Phycisphaerales bacterium]|nr:hypothetical protein [Phycisphaerales bacterium]
MDQAKQSNGLIWTIVFVIGAIMLVWSMSTSRTGQVWVTPEQHAFSEMRRGLGNLSMQATQQLATSNGQPITSSLIVTLHLS